MSGVMFGACFLGALCIVVSGLMFDLRDHVRDPASPFHQHALDLARSRNMNPDRYGQNARQFMFAAVVLTAGGWCGLIFLR